MLRHCAQRIATTGSVIGTGINAFAIKAALVSSAVSIRFAAGNAGTAFAQLSQWTLTLGAALVAALATCALLSTVAVLSAAAFCGAIGPAFVTFATWMTTLGR